MARPGPLTGSQLADWQFDLSATALSVHRIVSGLESGSASQAASDPRGSIPEEAMQLQPFDLNDISHEPSDEQLDDLMEAVAAEARRHGQAARAQLMVRLRAEITAIKPPCRREA
jgi:hypothetical protein